MVINHLLTGMILQLCKTAVNILLSNPHHVGFDRKPPAKKGVFPPKKIVFQGILKGSKCHELVPKLILVKFFSDLFVWKSTADYLKKNNRNPIFFGWFSKFPKEGHFQKSKMQKTGICSLNSHSYPILHTLRSRFCQLLRYERNPLPVGMNFFPSTNGHLFLNGRLLGPGTVFVPEKFGFFFVLLLMEEIRLTSWYGEYPIIYRVLYIPGGAGFLPSTVSTSEHLKLQWDDVLLGSRTHDGSMGLGIFLFTY